MTLPPSEHTPGQRVFVRRKPPTAVEALDAILQSLLTTLGDIIYRGDTKAERLPFDYGKGYNYLHAGPSGTPEWVDLEELIVYLTGAVNRAISPPSLVIPFLSQHLGYEWHDGADGTATPSKSIPVPAVAEAVVEDHAGGGSTTGESLTVPIPTVGAAAVLMP